MNNYFKAKGSTFLFDTNDTNSIRTAWDSAKLLHEYVVVFLPFSVPGPWSRCDIVGENRTPIARRHYDNADEKIREESQETVRRTEVRWNAVGAN